MNTDGSDYQVLHSFTDTGTDGANSLCRFDARRLDPVWNDGRGWRDGDGTVFSMNTDGSDYQVLYSFTIRHRRRESQSRFDARRLDPVWNDDGGWHNGDGTVFSIEHRRHRLPGAVFVGGHRRGVSRCRFDARRLGPVWNDDGGWQAADGTVFSINTDRQRLSGSAIRLPARPPTARIPMPV